MELFELEPVFRDKKGVRITKEEYLLSVKRNVEEEKTKEIGTELSRKRRRKAEFWLEAEKEMTFAITGDYAEVAKLEKDLKRMIWLGELQVKEEERRRKQTRKRHVSVSDM